MENNEQTQCQHI